MKNVLAMMVVAVACVGCKSRLVATGESDRVVADLALIRPNDLAPPSDLSMPMDLVGADLSAPPDLLNPNHAVRCDTAGKVQFDVTGELFQAPAITIEAWFRINSPSSGSSSEVMIASEQSDFELTIETNDGKPSAVAYFGHFVGSRGAGFIHSPDKQWHHVAAQYALTADGSAIAYSYYFDGKRRSFEMGEPFFVDFFNPTIVHLCSAKQGARFFGELDDVRLSKVARYDADFVPGALSDDPDTVVLLRFESVPLVDDSAHHRPITVINATPQLVPGPVY